MFTAVLFITAKKWKQHKCLSSGEWVHNNTVYSNNGKILAVRKNETLIHATM